MVLLLLCSVLHDIHHCSVEELRFVLSNIQEFIEIPKHEIDDIVEEADITGTGEINYEGKPPYKSESFLAFVSLFPLPDFPLFLPVSCTMAHTGPFILPSVLPS